MDRKLIVAIILSMGVLFFYPYVIEWYTPKLAQTETTESEAEQTPLATSSGETPSGTKDAQLKTPAIKAELTTVETPLFKAVFTNIGGGIKSLELKNYFIGEGKDSPSINISEIVGRSDSFKTQIEEDGLVKELVMSPSTTGIVVKEGDKAELVYKGLTASGIAIEKRYLITDASYLMETVIRASNPTKDQYAGKAFIQLASNVAGKDATGYHSGPIISAKGKVIRQADDEQQKTGAEKLKWIGLEDKYFLSAVIPAQENGAAWKTTVESVTSAKASVEVPLSLAPGAWQEYKYKTFLGPKEYDLLVKQKNGIEEAIEFGWFDWMAKPFLVVLNFFERYLGNYGIAIIVLTVLIKVIFYPLTKKSLHSMNEMKKMQPQMTALKEKYKGNKEKMNKELMELYKRYNVNPLGGCLPIVLQIPVFIALYEVLYVAIELRHAPFFLWLTDLSAKDPYYITPVLMGATMFIQQKMTPTSVDPTQAKIMLIMPIVFTFMFLNFPSGLVIYWLINNILSIVQQYQVMREPSKA